MYSLCDSPMFVDYSFLCCSVIYLATSHVFLPLLVFYHTTNECKCYQVGENVFDANHTLDICNSYQGGGGSDVIAFGQ